jgi:hypothetical protein
VFRYLNMDIGHFIPGSNVPSKWELEQNKKKKITFVRFPEKLEELKHKYRSKAKNCTFFIYSEFFEKLERKKSFNQL